MILKIEECVEDIKKQIKAFTDIVVIGLSGGADSTLVAILCTLALGKENVYGIELPDGIQDENTFNNKSKRLINLLNLNNSRIDIYDIVGSLLSNLNISDEYYMLTGNIKARIRMICLYAFCEKINTDRDDVKVRVIGTDNYSENFLGYFTKWGDGAVDINPIEELYKSEVYQLLDYFKDKGIITEECIDRVPSAGLWEGQTDEGELGMCYDEIEKGIRRITAKDFKTLQESSRSKNDIKILEMYYNTQHKREIPGHFKLRQYCN